MSVLLVLPRALRMEGGMLMRTGRVVVCSGFITRGCLLPEASSAHLPPGEGPEGGVVEGGVVEGGVVA